MIDTSLLALLPPVRRARGDRLYGVDQHHWVDLWKQGGAWLLGHRPEGAAREWKNQIDKGLAVPLPSRWTSRLQTHLNQLLGANATLRLYDSGPEAREALESWKGRPLGFQDAKNARWQPWRETPPQPRPGWEDVVLPVLPSGPARAVPVLITGDAQGLPEPPLVSVTEAAALCHAAVTLKRKLSDAAFCAGLDAVKRGFDKHIAPTGVFARNGMWLQATCEPEDYERLFRVFLEAGFVLSPDLDQESLLPLECSAGEWKALRLACEKFLQGESSWMFSEPA